MSRNTIFIITKVNPTQRFLKTHAELNGLPSDSEDVYLQSKFEIYLQRNESLYELTYPMYFQWWRKSTYSEQCKAEKCEGKSNSTVTVGFKGVDEFIELKQSIKDRIAAVKLFKDRLVNIHNKLKDQYNLQKAALLVIKDTYKHPGIIKCFSDTLQALGYCKDNIDDGDNGTKCIEILKDAGLLEPTLIDKANKPHWLHAKLLESCDDESITTLPLYKMFEMYPPGTMLKDVTGNYWVCRARAAITHLRFITVDDQENYYMQKYLLNISITPKDDVIVHPPLSWIQVTVNVNLVDQHHVVRVNLLDAVKRGFNIENIKTLVQMYLEHEFLEEEEAYAFLSTLPTGTNITEEIREVTDQLFGNGEDDNLLPPQNKSLDEYCKNFTDSQRQAFKWIKDNVELNHSQILAAIIGAAGCGKSYVMGAIVTYLRKCSLVVTKLAPSGVAVSLIKGTTIHNFLN